MNLMELNQYLEQLEGISFILKKLDIYGYKSKESYSFKTIK